MMKIMIKKERKDQKENFSNKDDTAHNSGFYKQVIFPTAAPKE